jgi:hypothetical protein
MPRSGDPGFEPDVTVFVVKALRTVWSLELLLLLRAAPDRVWTEQTLTAELRGNLGMVERLLERLEELGLAKRAGEGWSYGPASAELDDLCARTAAAYRQKPFAMISLIGRGEGTLRGLADAFRLKRGDP